VNLFALPGYYGRLDQVGSQQVERDAAECIYQNKEGDEGKAQSLIYSAGESGLQRFTLRLQRAISRQ
jgi:hypothetical protein